MTFRILILLIVLSILSPKNVVAINDPTERSNNKFGIHLSDPPNLKLASELVNSNGGDWGYVTYVIRKDDRNIAKWQSVFDEARRLHLIPIVRIASEQDDENWKKLEIIDIPNWVYFLNSLNWVIENRYVVVGNEPNHAREWGGEINPEEYSDYLLQFSKELKTSSNDFFLIPAGFDASAPTDKLHLDEVTYLERMIKKNPDLFHHIDGWSSHSYPNPNFSGSEYSTGRGSVKTYLWELSILKNMGLERELPVFITETGWAHDGDGDNGYLQIDDIGHRYEHLYKNVWTENYIVAITPFTLNYDQEPFSHFSWTDNILNPYPFFNSVKEIKKEIGSPKQIDNGKILFAVIPRLTMEGKRFSGSVNIYNSGQSIWNGKETQIAVVVNNDTFYFPIEVNIEPSSSAQVSFDTEYKFSENPTNFSISLIKNGEYFGNSYESTISVIKNDATLWEIIATTFDSLKSLVFTKRNEISLSF